MITETEILRQVMADPCVRVLCKTIIQQAMTKDIVDACQDIELALETIKRIADLRLNRSVNNG